MVVRRRFLKAAAAAFAAAPFGASAQAPAKRLRLGLLVSGYRSESRLNDALIQGLRERGLVEGDNLTFVVRDIEGRPERYPAKAAELVALAPDIILAPATPAARAAKQATAAIPILFVGDPDPVASGLVASLARPGGNVTGISNLGNEIFGKRLEILKQAVPGARRVAYLWQRGTFPARTEAEMLRRAGDDARALGLELLLVEARARADLREAFAEIEARRADTLVLNNPDPTLFGQRRRIAELAAAQKLPTMGNAREFVVDGGMLSYGPDFAASFRRIATYVDRIAKGVRPGDLAVERAATFELVVNLRTAATIGLTMPPALLARADEVMR